MIIKGIVEEDFVNYKKPSMVIQFPNCSFKCEKECGKRVCQNSALATEKNIEKDSKDIINRYLCNTITSAIICSGLEPLDSFGDVLDLLKLLRMNGCTDDFVIYTGYKEEECKQYETIFNHFGNVIVKYGRFIPNQEPHYDELLGINLASDNQYSKGYKLND
jgi:hypothetical protein